MLRQVPAGVPPLGDFKVGMAVAGAAARKVAWARQWIGTQA